MSEDQQQLLELSERESSSNTQLTETAPSPENSTAELLETETLNAATNDGSFVLVSSEGKSSGLQLEEGSSGGLQLEEGSSGEQRGTESPVTLRMSGRRSSLVPFFNRRSSFTPSYFKPLRFPVVAARKSSGSGKRYTSLHSSQQRLVFEEQEEEEKEEKEEEEDQQVEGGRGEEREGVREEGERDERRKVSGEEPTTLVQRVGQSFKRTLQNLKLFLT